jgi:hypothetical protein
MRRCLFTLCLGLILVAPLSAQTVARCGQGWLEKIDGYPVLHLKGSPYEMGFQQGALLKQAILKNMDNILVQKGEERIQVGFLKLRPRDAIEAIVNIQRPFVPAKYFDEMDGVAAGAGIKTKDVVAANFIPELFHCSGFAVMNSATKDGTLYHGRVLDYAIDWGLQEHAVVVIAEPDGAIPFVNVTYAGFIGSVTGMNAQHVSVGEMGGGGLGHWAGVPMSFLVREVLERGKDLDTAIAIFRDSPRTCQYFYVVADAKTNRAVGMEASWDNFFTIGPGESHPLLPTPVEDAVLLSAGGRYKELVRRAQAAHGSIDADAAQHLMDCGVAMKSNLHNVLFQPKTTKLWIANATADKKPAADQRYHEFQLSALLKRRPDMSAPEVKLVAKPVQRDAAAVAR